MPSTNRHTNLHGAHSWRLGKLTEANTRLLVVALKYHFGVNYAEQAGWVGLDASRLSRVASGGATLLPEDRLVIDAEALERGFDVLASSEGADGSLLDDLALILDATGSELANQLAGGSIASSGPNMQRAGRGLKGWQAEFTHDVRGPLPRTRKRTWPTSGDGASGAALPLSPGPSTGRSTI